MAQWANTAKMAEILGIHPKTLKKFKNKTTMFRERIHFRYAGLSTRTPIQWNPEATEKAFTNFRRIDPSQVETYGL